jgi:chemotaxis receptor (MCP) glutamine deamidase CheD
MIDEQNDVGWLTLLGRLPPEVGSVHEVSLGGIEVSSSHPLYSVIGASIAACLIDMPSGLVGLCHVMLPAKFGQHRDDAMLKADCALEALNNRMLEAIQAAGTRPHIRAKLFGGAELKKEGFSFSDGQQSSIFSRNWLRTRSIPILSESIGGQRRRELVLLPGTGTVFCKQVSMSSEFLAQERDGLLSTSAPLNKVELF